jgi:hypothetical protein
VGRTTETQFLVVRHFCFPEAVSQALWRLSYSFRPCKPTFPFYILLFSSFAPLYNICTPEPKKKMKNKKNKKTKKKRVTTMRRAFRKLSFKPYKEKERKRRGKRMRKKIRRIASTSASSAAQR